MAAKKKRVLIVEDALDVARLISSALESVDPNLKIMICPSAEEAMLESARVAVQLLITDIRLPGISGTEMIRKIRRRSPDLKVILITGLTETQIGRQMDGIQAQGFFRKPFDLNALIDVAERCLSDEEKAAEQSADQDAPAEPVKPEAQAQPSQPGALTAESPKKADLVEPLAKHLTRLRQDANALAVVLMDSEGKVRAMVGEFPGGAFEQKWAAPVLEALDGQKALSQRMGLEAPQSALILHGKVVNLVIAALGAYTLALAIRPQASLLRLALALEEALSGQAQIEAVLKNMAAAALVPVRAETPLEKPQESRSIAVDALSPKELPEPVKETLPEGPKAPKAARPPEPEAGLGSLAALFDAGGGGLKNEDVDAFWDSLAEASAIEPLAKDSISFEKARKLGLVNDFGD